MSAIGLLYVCETAGKYWRPYGIQPVRATAPKNSCVNELTASQQTPACAFCASAWAQHLHLCHLVQSGTEIAIKPAICHPFSGRCLLHQNSRTAWTGSPAPTSRGKPLPLPPHQEPTRYAKSTSSTEIRKMCQKRLPCLSPAQWTRQIFDGFEALKGVLCVLVLLDPPQRR